jgi:hypothetical protein
MKKSIILILLLFCYTYTVRGQNFQETISFLEATISSYPPLTNYKTKFELPDETEEDYFIYEKEVSNNFGGWAYTISNAVLIKDIESIILVREVQDAGVFHCIKLKLKENSKSNYFTTGNSGNSGGYLENLKICIPENEKIAEKIKKAIVHLGELKGVEIKDLDMF